MGLGEFIENFYVTSFTVNSSFLLMFAIVYPLRPFCVIVDLKYDFKRLNVENLISGEAEVMVMWQTVLTDLKAW